MLDQPLCPNCHRPYHPVEVHGHVQCSVCRVNIDPCCGGAALCILPFPSGEGWGEGRTDESPNDLDDIAGAQHAGV
jgi:hypothetical protein